MRRRLESEFGSSLNIFAGDNGRLLVVPDNLSIEDLAVEYMKVQATLQDYKKDHKDIQGILKTAALHLRQEIKKTQQNVDQPWPPQPDELNHDYVPLPDDLLQFLKTLLVNDRPDRLPSAQVQTSVWSLAQDIVYEVTGGTLQTAKHILLPWVVKTLTGNVEIIKMLNRLGHGISYSKLAEIDTALCLQKLAKHETYGVALPDNLVPDVPTVLAYDNIDRQEETLSGSGTSHRVNGIAVQKKQELPVTRPKKAPLDKKKARSITPTDLLLPVYTAGKRCNPKIRAPLPVDAQTEAQEAKHKNLVWSLVRQQDTSNQTVSSWTGFNIQVRDNVDVKQDTISYLPTINAPAAQLTTVNAVLCQALKIMDALNLQEIVCVFDQAMYAKAAEVVWKHQDKFHQIILRMGAFHTMCNLLSIIGKRFADAGLRDLAVESGAIAEGSIAAVLEGRQYNRGVRLHKLVYEALLRLAWKSFNSWLEQHHTEDMELMSNITKYLEDLQKNPSSINFETVLQHPACNHVLQLFTDYMDRLRHESGDLAAFWMTYIDLVEILLGLIRASREGNWLLHLHSIKSLIPWCFAYDKQNYARFLPVYYTDMTRLPIDHPRVYEHFVNGGFAVSIGKKNPFGRIPVDQAVEETVNKDTQCAGGTKGFSLKAGTVAKYYLTAEFRSIALKQLRDMIEIQCSEVCHADLEPSRRQKDEENVVSMVDILESQWTNPMNSDPSDIVNISTGTAVPTDIAKDLLETQKKGEAAYKDFEKDRILPGCTKELHDPIRRMKLKTFSSLKETNTSRTRTHTKEAVLKADHRIFGQMILIASNRQLNMAEVLKHPLGPLPWSLANADGTIKKTNKAALARALEKNVSPVDTIPQPSALVIDGMAILQKMHGENCTFEELSEQLLAQVKNMGYESERIDIVFDVYRNKSIKSLERKLRGSVEGIKYAKIMPGHKIKQWQRLLSCGTSKTKLVQFIAEDWQERLSKNLGTKTLYITSGEKCYKITVDGSEEVGDLKSTQEEADTRMVLHASHAAKNYDSVTIAADDTDVLIVSMALQSQINCNLFIRCGTKNNTRLLDVSRLCKSVGQRICAALPGMHAFTGCDTVSAFSGQGKLKAFKLLDNEDFQNAFADLGQRWQLSEDIFTALKAFTCQMYAVRSTASDINEQRYNIFRVRKGNIESSQLPPCKDCLRMHALRANYQAGIWQRSLQPCPDIPPPEETNAWELNEEDDLIIKWMVGLPAPEVVLDLLSCRCRNICKAPKCECIVNGLKCSDACNCYLENCSNLHISDETEDDQEQDTSDDEI